MHINISFYFKTAHDNLDQKMLDELEQKCISRDNKDNKDNVKDFVSIMLAKMTKKYNKNKVLRAMIVYCLTYGGVEVDRYNRLT